MREQPSLIRRVVGEISGSDGGNIEVITSEIKNSEEFLRFKPKNSTRSDENWLLSVRAWGLWHTINHDWQDWEQDNAGPDEMWFGELQEEFVGEHGPGKGLDEEAFSTWFDAFKKFILASLKGRDMNQLGNFGKWAQEAGITDREMLVKIAEEFLND